MKEELIRLRHSLQQLEDRAENIETDIRNAMSEGMYNQCVMVYTACFHYSNIKCKPCYVLLIYSWCLHCIGDREQEENLMQEWFSILNKKNELIKRQMELNFM